MGNLIAWLDKRTRPQVFSAVVGSWAVGTVFCWWAVLNSWGRTNTPDLMADAVDLSMLAATFVPLGWSALGIVAFARRSNAPLWAFGKWHLVGLASSVPLASALTVWSDNGLSMEAALVGYPIAFMMNHLFVGFYIPVTAAVLLAWATLFVKRAGAIAALTVLASLSWSVGAVIGFALGNA